MFTFTAQTVLIILFALTGIWAVSQIAAHNRSKQTDFEALATKLDALYLKNSADPANFFGDSIITTRHALLSDIIHSQSEPEFVFANAALSRRDQSTSEFFSLVAVHNTHTKFPHLLIQPQGDKLISAAEISNETNLRPAELAGHHMNVFVPVGYELEGLQSLTPSTLERLAQLDFIIETFANSVILIRPGILQANNAEAFIAAGRDTATWLKGINKLTPIGDLPPTLQTFRPGELAFTWGRPILVIGVLSATLGLAALALAWLTGSL